MADEDDGNLHSLQFSDDLEQSPHLGAGQRGGRLIHEDQPCIGRQPAGNRNNLTLRDGQRPDNRVERQLVFEVLQDRTCGNAHLAPGNRPCRVSEQLIDCNVFGNAQIRKQRKILVDDLYPEFLRAVRGHRPVMPAVYVNRTFPVWRMHAGQDFDKR